MDDNTISVSISDEEREFVDGQIASGNFADDQDVLRAGLAALERDQRLLSLRGMIAVADEQIQRGDYRMFDEADDLTQYIVDNADALRR